MSIKTTAPLRLICLITACFAFLSTIQGQDSLADLPSFQKGCVALEKKDFASGATSFEKTWNIIAEGDAGVTEQNLVASRLLKCWVSDGKSDHAVIWLHQNREQFQPGSESNFWIARALQNEERYAEAARYYSTLVKANSSLPRDLISNYAWCLDRSGNPALALETLEAAFDPATDQDRIARAQMAFDSGRFTKAQNYLAPVFPRINGLSPHWQFFARKLRAKSLSKINQGKLAISEILSWIQELDQPEQIYRAFALLREIALPNDSKTIIGQLNEWENSKNSPTNLKIAAEYTKTILTKPSIEGLKEFIDKHQQHPLANEARIALLQLDPNHGQTLTIDELHPDLIARFRYTEATQSFQKKAFQQAILKFEAAAVSKNGKERQRALYNTAVVALYSDDEDLFEKLRKQLLEFDEKAPEIGDLLYLTGLHYASEGSGKAFDALNKFVRNFPNHSSLIEAELALAEIHLNQVPPRPQSAREIFNKLLQRPLTLTQTERLDYTAVWTESIAQNPVKMIALADRFLEDWPNSDSRAEVSMLLGTAYYRRGDQHDARKIFLQIARDNAQSEFAGPARFFAAKTSPPNEDALQEWTDIINLKGPLSQSARHEKGLLLLTMNRYGEARERFNEVIEKETPESGLRIAAMSDLGFAWYIEALANERDKVMLGMAANVFGQISRLREANRAWRFQSAVRRGKCIEALGNLSVALEIYDSIVAESNDTDLFFGVESPVQENEWRYRAGFSAIEILESKDDWLGAIKMADALSKKNGPRAIEAARHADLLRLKHWIWE